MDENDRVHKDQKVPRWNNTLTVVAGTLFLVDLALKYLPVCWDKIKWPQNGGIDVTGFALAALAVLPWMSAHLATLKLPGGIDLAFRDVERRQDMTERAIRQLRFIVDGFLTRFEYQHLLNIRDHQEYKVEKLEAGPLAAELRRLRALGLITNVSRDRGVTDFTRANDQKRKIDEWFRLTPRGEEYLRIRKDNEKLGPADADEAIAASSLPSPDAVLDQTKI
jgi:hypothetical protein